MSVFANMGSRYALTHPSVVSKPQTSPLTSQTSVSKSQTSPLTFNTSLYIDEKLTFKTRKSDHELTGNFLLDRDFKVTGANVIYNTNTGQRSIPVVLRNYKDRETFVNLDTFISLLTNLPLPPLSSPYQSPAYGLTIRYEDDSDITKNINELTTYDLENIYPLIMFKTLYKSINPRSSQKFNQTIKKQIFKPIWAHIKKKEWLDILNKYDDEFKRKMLQSQIDQEIKQIILSTLGLSPKPSEMDGQISALQSEITFLTEQETEIRTKRLQKQQKLRRLLNQGSRF